MKKFIKTTVHSFTGILIIGGVLLITACDKDKDSGPEVINKNNSVKAVFEKEEKFSLLNEAIEISSQNSFFSNTNANITVFAANNDAFNDLFAEMNVSSMSELQAKMGNEAFANLILYHAIPGKFDMFLDGFKETYALSSDSSNLSLHIDSESNRLEFNGNDHSGAATVDNSTISTTNGNIIEIDAVLQAQSNYDNIWDGRQNENTMFVNAITSSESSLIAMLSDENQQSTVLVADYIGLQTMLAINLSSILDVNDLDSLLNANEKTALYNALGVSTTADLLSIVTLSEIYSFTSLTLFDMFDEFESDDFTELANTCIYANNYDLVEIAANNGSITSEAGVTFDVHLYNSNTIILLDNNGYYILLDIQPVQSVNGSIYTVLEISEI